MWGCLNILNGVFLLLNLTIHRAVKCTVIILMVVLVVKFDIPMVVLVIDNGGMTSVAAAAPISVNNDSGVILYCELIILNKIFSLSLFFLIEI